MQLDVLKERIKGCQLKREYLEAFLLQGAYIEGIIKQLVELWIYMQMRKENKSHNYKKFEDAILKRAKRYGLYDMVEILFDMGNITDAERKKLHTYRDKRNEVIHSLLTKIKSQNLDDELIESLKLGDEIMTTPQFTALEDIIIDLEKDTNKEVNKTS